MGHLQEMLAWVIWTSYIHDPSLETGLRLHWLSGWSLAGAGWSAGWSASILVLLDHFDTLDCGILLDQLQGLGMGGTVWVSMGGSQRWLQLGLMGKRSLVCGPGFVRFCRVWCSSRPFLVSVWSPWVKSFDGKGWGIINMLISRFIYPPLAGQAMPWRSCLDIWRLWRTGWGRTDFSPTLARLSGWLRIFHC